MGIPVWVKNAEELIEKTLPPHELEVRCWECMTFLDSLTLAIALREEGELLLKALKEKWPEAVEKSMEEASKLAEVSLAQVDNL